MKAYDILATGQQHLKDRGQQYDAPQGERSMAKTVKIFNSISGRDLSEKEGWIFMMSLKFARAMQGKPKADTYEDLAAYAALLGEHELGKLE